MVTKVKDLTVDELKELVSDTVRLVVKDSIEDLMALQSEEYVDSIKEARADYKAGRTKRFKDVFDV